MDSRPYGFRVQALEFFGFGVVRVQGCRVVMGLGCGALGFGWVYSNRLSGSSVNYFPFLQHAKSKRNGDRQ